MRQGNSLRVTCCVTLPSPNATCLPKTSNSGRAATRVYLYLGILGVPTPPLYGLTSEEVRAQSKS
jgi:hypothetical protein